ncbi:hypothetical protein QTI66_18145 [Variovorax sp. J22R133]|uniref:hypothetical protein n=1 Tax=Variovorax brevis TaxID=3053503 RepID=UPI002578ADE3|nr:hypothetical protein [Variovorax sp. J22R133]MDM0114081.1 hypothetical protein [Variovorax sp. J22R133]
MIASHAKKASAPPAIEFGRLGVLLELLWRGEKAIPVRCNFCQTLNHHNALHCEACSGRLPGGYRNDSAEPVQAEPSHQSNPNTEGGRRTPREWVHMLGWVLAMPLALFIGFAGWYYDFMHERQAMGMPAVAGAVQAQEAGQTSPAAQGPSWTNEPVKTASLRPLPANEEDDGEVIIEERAATSATERHMDASRSAAKVIRANRIAPRTEAADPTAVCNGEMFLLRAICLNRRCAEPQHARHPRCLAVAKQRRLDEARRNPELMG